jgi:brefeldin A-inhibited guanine nucleotide-exchange protein
MFAASTPADLVTFDADVQAKQDADGVPKDQQRQSLDFNAIIIKCVVQLEMIQAVENIVLQETAHTVRERASDHDIAADDQQGMYEYLDNSQMKALLDCLRESHDFAKAFNANHRLRTALWKAGELVQAKQGHASLSSRAGCCLLALAIGGCADPPLTITSPGMACTFCRVHEAAAQPAEAGD